jgi:hypothetical protein
MPTGIGAGVAEATQAFLFYGLIWIAYNGAKLVASETTPFKLILKGLVACGIFAAFAAAMLGQPSCDEVGESLNGGCEAYADGGYIPTQGQRTKHFTQLLLVTFLPILIVAMNERKRRRELALIEEYALMKKANEDRS